MENIIELMENKIDVKHQIFQIRSQFLKNMKNVDCTQTTLCLTLSNDTIYVLFK